MRRMLLWAGALGFALFELVAVLRWLAVAGSLSLAVAQMWVRLGADWFLLIVVADHLVIAGTVLLWVWMDARRRGWPTGRRLAWTVAFIALGTPALLGYIAERTEAEPKVVDAGD